MICYRLYVHSYTEEPRTAMNHKKKQLTQTEFFFAVVSFFPISHICNSRLASNSFIKFKICIVLLVQPKKKSLLCIVYTKTECSLGYLNYNLYAIVGSKKKRKEKTKNEICFPYIPIYFSYWTFYHKYICAYIVYT